MLASVQTTLASGENVSSSLEVDLNGQLRFGRGLLVLTTDDENLRNRFQLTTAGVLAACSGLIFAVILKHNQLRSLLGTRGVSYIEIIPILLYLAIAAVIINAILLASPVQLRFIHHRNNLWPVLLYWPLLLGTILSTTLYLFFIA